MHLTDLMRKTGLTLKPILKTSCLFVLFLTVFLPFAPAEREAIPAKGAKLPPAPPPLPNVYAEEFFMSPAQRLAYEASD
ncbi:MAG: hypothetical protein PHN49_09120, partial [Candidatus Omnitrophica bacterium]|nr:hypothetical protein [Candidatus Omnitrophota bacterium]